MFGSALSRILTLVYADFWCFVVLDRSVGILL
jgi:hypothetical protein